MPASPAELALIPLGILAGALTTLAGLGGGLILVATLALLFDARTALAITAPALMIGNLHRSILYRRHVATDVAMRVAGGGFVGALLFGWFALRCPDLLLRVLLLSATALALAKVLGFVELTIERRFLAPMGFVVGAVTATSGGGQALLAPTLLSVGLSGEVYVSTAATCALMVHVGRVIAYGSGGAMDGRTLARAGALAAFVLVGNLLGSRLRPRLHVSTLRALELGALVLVVVLTIGGFGR